MMRKIRKDPKPGTVVLIPLPDGRYGYVCQIRNFSWIYNFVTDFPSKAKHYFSPDYWWKLLSVTRFRVDMRDVCKLDLTLEQLTPPPTVQIWNRPGEPPECLVTDERFDFHDPRGRYHVSPEEATKFHRYDVRDFPNLIQKIVDHESELRMIQVPPAERALDLLQPNVEDKGGWADDEPRIIEVNFEGTTGMTIRDREGIEDCLAEELDHYECGEITGGGELTGGPEGPGAPLDVFDIVIEAEPGKTAKAIQCIQRILKELKAPPTTEILELDPEQEDPIKHPLHVPRKKR